MQLKWKRIIIIKENNICCTMKRNKDTKGKQNAQIKQTNNTDKNKKKLKEESEKGDLTFFRFLSCNLFQANCSKVKLQQVSLRWQVIPLPSISGTD